MTNTNYHHGFDTVVEAINWLSKHGFIYDFSLDINCIRCENIYKLAPHEFNIDYLFRFEGLTDPSDESIVYGISSGSRNLKGVLINAYGVYANILSDEMIKKLTGNAGNNNKASSGWL